MTAIESAGMSFTDVGSTVAAEILLGKIRLRHMREPSYLPRLREIAMQFKKSLGAEAYNGLIQSGRPAVHACVDALFDAVTGVRREQTMERLKTLDPVYRTMVERAVASATGKGDREGRWSDELWRTKQELKRICDLSISGLTLAEVRDGLDEFVHATIDRLYDNIVTLVN
ncbi:hypothetical protein FJY94_02230 [Candidatus Kaiserbacteria bacterium]|nr:hypothetical protein [Candidatus Kaiserbacteria bacterium]